MWRFLSGVTSTWNRWTYRRIPHYHEARAKIVTDQGGVAIKAKFRNGVDYVEVTRRSGADAHLLYFGQMAGPDKKFTDSRPVRDGKVAAIRNNLGLSEWKLGCGNCAHAPDGWGSGCARANEEGNCGSYRWPNYGTSDHYPLWEPRDGGK